MSVVPYAPIDLKVGMVLRREDADGAPVDVQIARINQETDQDTGAVVRVGIYSREWETTPGQVYKIPAQSHLLPFSLDPDKTAWVVQ